MIADFGSTAARGEGLGGDPRYCAPEVIVFSEATTNATDCWSLGVTLYELLCGQLPFIKHRNISGWLDFQRHQDGKLIRRLQRAWNQVERGKLREVDCAEVEEGPGRDLARRMLQVDPAARLGLSQALRHPFLELAAHLERRRAAPALPSEAIAAHVQHFKGFKLRQVIIQLVESRLQGEHLDFYANLWDRYDIDGIGTLSRARFDAYWETVAYPAGERKPPAEQVFEIVDMDADGRVTFDDFVALNFDLDLLDPDARERCLHSAFESIQSPDGGVHLHNLRDMLGDQAQVAVEHLFAEMDASAQGIITREEFFDYVESLNAREWQPLRNTCFSAEEL
uniref:Calmodulin n=1 Tax=Zooxanthella nutricula TaxID=1333877 RepID=A0A7S2KUB8_9DINO